MSKKLPRVPVPKPTRVMRKKGERKTSKSSRRVREQAEALEEWGRHTER